MWISCLLFAACQSTPRYTVEGRVSGYEGRVLLLTPKVTGDWDTLGSVLSADGTFTFSGELTEPVLAEILAVNANLRIPLLLENAIFTVEADAAHPADYVVGGGGDLQPRCDSGRWESGGGGDGQHRIFQSQISGGQASGIP